MKLCETCEFFKDNQCIYYLIEYLEDGKPSQRYYGGSGSATEYTPPPKKNFRRGLDLSSGTGTSSGSSGYYQVEVKITKKDTNAKEHSGNQEYIKKGECHYYKNCQTKFSILLDF